MDITFHPDAAERFNELAEECLKAVISVGEPQVRAQKDYNLFPAATVTSDDIVGDIRTVELVYERGDEVGRRWRGATGNYALLNPAYTKLKEMAARLERSPNLRDRVTVEFVTNELFSWLSRRVDSKSDEAMTQYLAERCAAEIKTHEIWVPLFFVFSSQQFQIGEVSFRTISSEMMSRFFEKKDAVLDDIARHHMNSMRSQLQGMLAACTTIMAEKNAAQQIARFKAEQAISLLRFLSPANWVPTLQSYCLPLGRERVEKSIELFVSDNEIKSISQTALSREPAWDVDVAISYLPGLLEQLHDLAANRDSDFRQRLYDAMLLYSRNSIAHEIADKLVFVLVAVESMLLKDSNEPISKNIGERMAFLIGNSVEQRKAILTDVTSAYALRSAFIHHGNTVEDIETVGRFLTHAWATFRAFLGWMGRVKSRLELIEHLENRKLA